MSFLFNLASSITSALEGDPTPASDAVDGDDSVQAKWDTTAGRIFEWSASTAFSGQINFLPTNLTFYPFG